MTTNEIQALPNGLIELLYDCAVDSTHFPELVKALLSYYQSAPAPADLEAISRHIARAERLASTYGGGGSAYTVNRMPAPALLIDEAGKIQAINALADSLPYPLWQDGELGITRHDQRAVTSAVRMLAQGQRPHVPLFVGDTAGETHHVHLLPADPLESSGYLVLILSAWMPARYVQTIAQAFGLTPSEARLCMTLATGKSLREMADMFAVSKNTLRTHLAAAFSKTGTHSQAELVSRVLECVFGLGQLENGIGWQGLATVSPPRFHRLPGGRSLAWREYGDADGWPVIVTHGFADVGLQRPQEDEIARRAGLRLICPDRPGIGRSEYLKDCTPDKYADDLRSLANSLGLKAYDVMGLSYGALDATVFASLAGSRLRKLILVSPNFPEPPEAITGSAFRAIRESLSASDLLIDSWYRLNLKIMRARGFEFFQRHLGNTAECDFEAMAADPDMVARLEAGVFESTRQGVGAVREFLRIHAKAPAESYNSFAGPVVLWHGEDDGDTPLSSVQTSVSGMKQVAWRIEPGMGHRLYFLKFRDIAADIAGTSPP